MPPWVLHVDSQPEYRPAIYIYRIFPESPWWKMQRQVGLQHKQCLMPVFATLLPPPERVSPGPTTKQRLVSDCSLVPPAKDQLFPQTYPLVMNCAIWKYPTNNRNHVALPRLITTYAFCDSAMHRCLFQRQHLRACYSILTALLSPAGTSRGTRDRHPNPQAVGSLG